MHDNVNGDWVISAVALIIKLNTNRLFEMKIERKIRSQGTSAGLQIIFFLLKEHVLC